MRFNSPPNWPPSPPGWTPPPDWRPDPSWPPPPPGWQLWVDDTPPSSKKGLIIGGIAAALVVVIGVVLAVVVFSKDTPQVTVTKPTTSATNSTANDEDEIKDVVKSYEDAWNDEDFDSFDPIVCEKIKDDEEFNENDFLTARQRNGEYDLVVKDVDVNGDKATATVKNGSNTADDIDFVREDGEWKWCDV